MTNLSWWIAAAIACCSAAVLEPAHAQTAAATLVVAARADAPDGGGTLRFQISLSNTGPAAIAVGPASTLFGWLVLTSGRDKAFFSDKIALSPATPWPAALAPGATISFPTVDATLANGYPYGQGLRIDRGYPLSASGAPATAAGRMGALLPDGRGRARWLIGVPQPEEMPPLLARSAPIEITMSSGAPSPAATNSPASTAALLLQFNRDPWSAQQAHDQAVKRGPAILPDLIAAVSEPTRPGYARLWLATAIADIPSEQAVVALTRLLDDPDAEVRCVVGYHGPKQKSPTLDRAIVAAAQAAHHARLTSYALLGFLVFRGEAPDGLLKAGLECDDPRARDAAARALATMASEQNTTRLQALLQDKDPRVRATAERVLKALRPAEKPVAQ